MPVFIESPVALAATGNDVSHLLRELRLGILSHQHYIAREGLFDAFIVEQTVSDGLLQREYLLQEPYQGGLQLGHYLLQLKYPDLKLVALLFPHLSPVLVGQISQLWGHQ